MKTKNINYDVAIVGAGPAGIMAAIAAAGLGQKVVLLEKNNIIAKKLLLSGNGRCNLTNAEFNLQKLVTNYKNGEFLFHAFFVFGVAKTIEFFKLIGTKIKVEENNRVFPITEKAKDVQNALIKKLLESNVEIIYNSEVTDIDFKNRVINKLILNDREITAKKYIISTGGKSYPQTGSDGSMYKLIEKLGHTIVSPKPALTPIKLKESFVKDLQGVSLKNSKVSVLCDGKKLISQAGEIIFTHFGVSGPVALNISSFLGDLSSKNCKEIKLSLDFVPQINQDIVVANIKKLIGNSNKKIIKNVLQFFVPEKLGDVLLTVIKIDKNKIANNLSKKEIELIANCLKNFVVTYEGLMDFEVAKVTSGGVSIEQIDHKTMRSKLINNLYFAGEVIDVDGKTGGFNLQMCWSTGYLAGTK